MGLGPAFFVFVVLARRWRREKDPGTGWMLMTSLDSAIEELIEPTVADLGYAVVRVRLSGQQRARLQVMIERLDEQPMDVDDCAEVSRAISTVLDVEDPISGSYTLEVSSPGIDRPLVRVADYDRWAGFAAKVEMEVPVNGRRRFTGRLAGTEGSTIRLHTENGDVVLPFAEIRKAKLLLTDDLIDAHAPLDRKTIE